MNNKLYKNHKPNPKSTNKKTTSQSKNKNKIKSGGAFPSLSSLFSKRKLEILNNKSELNPLLPPNKNNSLEIANTQPNAKPQGFNTIKAQSRCSIL
jgi:hypothetical protein